MPGFLDSDLGYCASLKFNQVNAGRFVRIRLIGAVGLVVILFIAVQLWMYRGTSVVGFAPRPAAGLQEIQSVTDLQTFFDRDMGKPRLVVLISPT